MASNPSWRQYQASLQKKYACRLRAYRISRLLLRLVLVAIPCLLLIHFYPALVIRAPFSGKPDIDPAAPESHTTTRADLAAALDPGLFHRLGGDEIPFSLNGEPVKARVTLDPSFQQYMMDITRREHATAMAFVAMDPSSGRVLAMTGFDAGDPDRNPCIETLYPAASIFKIVTAAAAVEDLGFHENTTFTFHGGKHTLYKSQIARTHPQGDPISFENAFGESVNPVFGQLGANHLKKERMEKYAEILGFNQPLDFDASVAVSEFAVTEDPYHLAEIASGFNRATRITPLHAAVIASLVVHDGSWPSPHLVASVTDGDGRILYAHPPEHRRVMKKRTAQTLQRMMTATIRSGTCKKAFRGYTKDPVLSGLDIGGKTGSICGDTCETRYDWFVGFARAKKGTGAIAVACVVVHDKLLGTRSMEYAKNAMHFYFQYHR